MLKGQNQIMLFDPVTREEKPYPSHAQQYRVYHGKVVWLYNPWTGNKRSPLDIGKDVLGLKIVVENAGGTLVPVQTISNNSILNFDNEEDI